MEIRTDRGWIKAGLAVLVTGVLGGGVMAATGIGPPRGPHKVTADGVTGGKGAAAAAADKPLDLAAAPPAVQTDDGPRKGDPTVGDKVLMGDDGGSVTVSAVEDDVSAGRLLSAGKGFKYVAAEVKGCSGPHEKNITFEPAYFLLRLDDGTVHDPGPGIKKPSLDGGTVPTGKCLTGWVTYTVREGGIPTGLIYDGSVRTTWTVPLPKNYKATTTTTGRAGASAETATADDSETTSSTKPKTTATTSKPTATTSKSTATTSKSTTTTSSPKSPSATPTTSSGKTAASTTTTAPAKTSTTTATTGKTATSADTAD